MATEFIPSPVISESYVLTSQAKSVGVTTDQTKLDVSLAADGDTFFSVELYALDGKVELFDPGSIIEDYCRRTGDIVLPVDITFGTATKNILFLYCEYEMPPTLVPSSVPLLSASAHRVHAGSSFSFAVLPAGPHDAFCIKAVGHRADGRIASVSFSDTTDISDSYHADFNVDDIVAKALQQSAPAIVDVLYFSVEHGGRQLMCYIAPSPAFLTFRFRNIYNVPELADVEGSMVVKSDTSREKAICAGDIVQYDRRTDRTYQFVTGPLPSVEVETLLQLVASYSLQIHIDGAFYDVVIEDHTCEPSTADDSLEVIKFTWRFKGRRPVSFNSPAFGIAPTSRGIFSDQFTPEYE